MNTTTGDSVKPPLYIFTSSLKLFLVLTRVVQVVIITLRVTGEDEGKLYEAIHCKQDQISIVNLNE